MVYPGGSSIGSPVMAGSGGGRDRSGGAAFGFSRVAFGGPWAWVYVFKCFENGQRKGLTPRNT
ncbi:hypothetical protein YC2023_019675 [Brassica napus]